MPADPHFDLHLTGDALFDRYAQAATARARRMEKRHELVVEAGIAAYGLEHLRSDLRQLSLALEREMDAERFASGKAPKHLKQVVNEYSDSYYFHVLPEQAIRDWESEFGSDARYWQLLAKNSQNFRRSEDPADHYLRLRPRRFEILIEAHQKKCADGQCYLMLTELFEYAADSYVDKRLQTIAHMRESLEPEYEINQLRHSVADFKERFGTTHPDHLRFMEQQLKDMEAEGPRERWVDETALALTQIDFSRDQDQALSLIQQLGLSEAQVFDHAVATSVHWAQTYYRRALYRFENEDLSGGLSDVCRGNLAEHSQLPCPFPSSFAIRQAEKGLVPGTLALFFHLNDQGELLKNWNPWLLQAAASRLGTEASLAERLEALHQFGLMVIRGAQAHLSQRTDALSAFAMILRLLRPLTEVLPEPGAERLADFLNSTNERMHSISKDMPESLPAEREGAGYSLTFAEESRRSHPLYKLTFDNVSKEREFLQRVLFPLGEDLRRLDLASLAQ